MIFLNQFQTVHNSLDLTSLHLAHLAWVVSCATMKQVVLIILQDAMDSFMFTVVELKGKKVMDRLFGATRQTDTIVAGIKRRQDRLHDRMLVSAAKKFCPANIDDNIVIPIERPDKMTSLGPRNMLGVVTDVSEGSYTVGTRDGTVSTNYTRIQFDICSSNIFLQPSLVPAVTITQTSAMRNASLGIDMKSCCRCSYCKTIRCPCRKSGRSCGTKCHMGAKCFNSGNY